MAHVSLNVHRHHSPSADTNDLQTEDKKEVNSPD